MVKLIIKFADGKIRNTEHFDSMAECNEWLKVEKTKFYWQADFTHEIEDRTAEIAAEKKAIADQIQARKQALETAKAELKAFKQKKNRTVADAVAAVDRIMDVLGLE